MTGASTVREVDLQTGETLREHQLAHSDFAEGITQLGDRCVRIWKVQWHETWWTYVCVSLCASVSRERAQV